MPRRENLGNRRSATRPDPQSEVSTDYADVRNISATQLERGLRIDEHALEEALMSQPDSFYRVAKRLALVISLRDEAKQALQEEEAKVDGTVRHDAEVAGEKITEKQVESEKRMDRDVQAKQRALMALNAEVGLLSALKEAFHQRSYVLKDLCTLHVAGYYGDNIDPATRGSVNKFKEATAQRARDSMARRREERRNGD